MSQMQETSGGVSQQRRRGRRKTAQRGSYGDYGDYGGYGDLDRPAAAGFDENDPPHGQTRSPQHECPCGSGEKVQGIATASLR